MRVKSATYKTGEKALTRDQAEALFMSVTELGDLALLKLAVDTGIRREDIVALRSRNIDFKNKMLTFEERKKKRIRTMAIGDNACQALEMWMNRNTSEWVFPSRFKRGKHLSGRTAYNILKHYLEKSKLPQRPFHALRATSYKLMQDAKWRPEEAAKRLGDTVRVALEHYATPSDEEITKRVREQPAI